MNSHDSDGKNKMRNHPASWLGGGFMAGTIVGTIIGEVTGDLSTWLAIGVALGVVLGGTGGALQSKRKDGK